MRELKPGSIWKHFKGRIYNRFAKTPHFSAGDEGKARFQASTEANSKAVESLTEKTPPFQGGEAYKIVGVARYSEDMEKEFVVYSPVEPSPEYGPDQMAVRPKEMFLEKITRDGKTFYRFEEIT